MADGYFSEGTVYLCTDNFSSFRLSRAQSRRGQEEREQINRSFSSKGKNNFTAILLQQ